MAVVHTVTPYGRKRVGLCSGFLASLQVGDHVKLRIKPGVIRDSQLVNMTTPCILVGPGTGVAPMRAYILDYVHYCLSHIQETHAMKSRLVHHASFSPQDVRTSEVSTPSGVETVFSLGKSLTERATADAPQSSANIDQSALSASISKTEVSGSSSSSLPQILLFFGCRKKEMDYLYGLEWDAINRADYSFLANGTQIGHAFTGTQTIVLYYPRDSLVVVSVYVNQRNGIGKKKDYLCMYNTFHNDVLFCRRYAASNPDCIGIFAANSIEKTLCNSRYKGKWWISMRAAVQGKHHTDSLYMLQTIVGRYCSESVFNSACY